MIQVRPMPGQEVLHNQKWHRIARLADSLVLKALSHIILDVTYMDSKNKSMLDTLETKEELFKKFFTNKKILERLRNGKCSLVIF